MGDPVYDFLNSGGQTAPASPAASPAGKASADPVYEFLNSGGKSIPAPVETPKPQQYRTGRPVPSFTQDHAIDETVAHVVTAGGSAILGGWQALSRLASGGTLEDAANAAREQMETGTYQPEGEAGRSMVENFESPKNPLNWIPIGAKKAGELAQDLGANAGTATAIETGINAIPAVVGLKGKPVLRSVKAGDGAPPIEARVEPTLSAGQSVEKPIVKALAQEDIQPPIPLDIKQPVPVKAVNQEQFIKQADLAEEVPKFLDAAPESATAVDKASRAKTLQRIGLTEARESAISGDAKAGATDFQISKLDNAAGNHMRGVLDSERAALTNHAEGIVRDTGGTIGTDASALYGRGSAILAALDALKDFFDRGISALYKEADARAQGLPTKLDSFSQVLSDDSLMTNSDRVHLRDSMGAYLKKLGISDTQEITVAQAETIRKRLNENWSPQNSKYTSALKDALDDDVMKAAGDDVYEAARALRAKRGRVLDDPKGIAKLMDSSGPDGINRSVPVEKIADTLTGLPADQLAHVLKTLKDVPPELKPQADAALAEIKAQFANKVLDAGSSRMGQWGARDVSKYLNNNAARLKQVFTPEELDKFNDLNNAGHILAKDQSYPGAAVQEHNLVQRGAMAGVRAGSAATGGALFGPLGAAAGNVVGDLAAKALGERSALKSSQKRVVRLSDFPGIND